MPGKSVKDWKLYHKMRKKGYSKGKSARLTNYIVKRRRKKRKRKS